MAIIGEWIRRLGYLLRRRAREDELRREMEAHRAQMGEPPAFGNTLRLREEARDAWGWRWLDDLVQDTRFAWRTLRHSPGFALTAIVTLALGIGVNIGMFSLINGLLLRPLYARRRRRGGACTAAARRRPEEHRAFSYPNYRDLQEGTTDIFANLAAYSTGFVGLDVGDGPRRTMASAVTANYFQVFGVPLAHGRPFTAEEERPGAGIRVAIISYPLWEQLGADPGMLGRLVRINGEQFTVVGVAREGFAGTGIPGPEVWLPLGAHETFSTRRAGRPFGAREAHELSVVGRLRPGTSVETAAAALATVGRRLEQAFPSVNAGYSLEMSRPSSRLMFMPGAGSGASDGSGPAPDAHAGDRPARGVPQPRRSVAGARSRAPAGTGHQVVTRWRPIAPHSATAHRRVAPRAGRRPRSGCCCRRGRPGAAGVAASRAPRRLESSRRQSRLASSPRHHGVQSRRHAGLRRRAGLALTGRAAAADLKRHTGDEGRRPRRRAGSAMPW